MARDYDPAKAHEYYIAHRKLKGSNASNPLMSTKGLSKKGKEVARFVKEQIKVEKKTEITAAREQLKAKITSMREAFKSMSKGEKAAKREALKAEVKGLREGWKTTMADTKLKYDDEYVKELQGLKKKYPAKR